MPTLIERTRQVVAAENDDFFKAETILYYLNKSERKIVSFMVQREREMNNSLRALDNLKKNTNINVNGLTFTNNGLYFSVQVTFPSTPGEEINQFSFLKYDKRTVLRELTQNNLVKLDWGNLKANEFESYYQVINNGTDKVFELYLPSDDSSTDKELKIYYVLNPTPLEITDEELSGLPEQLENAVIYGAATMMVMQESVKDPESQVQLFQQLYQEELQANAY